MRECIKKFNKLLNRSKGSSPHRLHPAQRGLRAAKQIKKKSAMMNCDLRIEPRWRLPDKGLEPGKQISKSKREKTLDAPCDFERFA